MSVVNWEQIKNYNRFFYRVFLFRIDLSGQPEPEEKFSTN